LGGGREECLEIRGQRENTGGVTFHTSKICSEGRGGYRHFSTLQHEGESEKEKKKKESNPVGGKRKKPLTRFSPGKSSPKSH